MSVIREEIKKWRTVVSFGKPQIHYNRDLNKFTQEPMNGLTASVMPEFSPTIGFCDSCGRLSPTKISARTYKDFMKHDPEKFELLFNTDFSHMDQEQTVFITTIQGLAQSIVIRYRVLNNLDFFNNIVNREGKNPDRYDINERRLRMDFYYKTEFDCKILRYFENGDTGFVSPSAGLHVLKEGLDLDFPFPLKHRNYSNFDDYASDYAKQLEYCERILTSISANLAKMASTFIGSVRDFEQELSHLFGISFVASKPWKYDGIIRNLCRNKGLSTLPSFGAKDVTMLEMLSVPDNALIAYSKKTEMDMLREKIREYIEK